MFRFYDQKPLLLLLLLENELELNKDIEIVKFI